MTPDITIVLPLYNGSRYLKESLNSIIDQTFQNYECIICDDGSTDYPEEIIHRQQDDRIQYLKNEENTGLFPTLNKLISLARGKLIKLWSQDDVMLPDCLRIIVLFHQQYPGISFSYSDRYIINETSQVIGSVDTSKDSTPEYIPRLLHDRIAFYTGSIAGNISNLTLVTSRWKEVGGFDESMKISADFDMLVKLTACYDIGRIQKPIVKIRDHPLQLSRLSKYYIRHLSEDMKIYEKLKQRSAPDLLTFGEYYLKWNKGPLYFSFMLKTFVADGIKNGLQFYSEFSKYFNVFEISFIWLFKKTGLIRRKQDVLFRAVS